MTEADMTEEIVALQRANMELVNRLASLETALRALPHDDWCCTNGCSLGGVHTRLVTEDWVQPTQSIMRYEPCPRECTCTRAPITAILDAL